jgi:hypothetical protein
MSFWNSPLIKGIQQGKLPTVETDNKVSIDTSSMVTLGVILISVTVVIALMIVLVRKPKP